MGSIGNFWKKLTRKLRLGRAAVLALFFVGLSAVLVYRLFVLQIIQGEQYVTTFQDQTTKTRTIKSTRGNIYDRDGNILATNQLAYTLTLEDNGSYDTTRIKNLTLNGILHQLYLLLVKNGDAIDTSGFHINLDENGRPVFDVDEGFTLNRFRADIYGQPLFDDLEEDQKTATALELMDDLCDASRFGICRGGRKDSYTQKEQEQYRLPEYFSGEELIYVTKIRYELSNNRFMKYLAVDIATDVSETTIASVMENKLFYQGIDVVEDSIRVYEDDESLGPILGYTGKASAEELEELRDEDESYTINAVIGKAGIEQYMETTLKGTDGQETVSVDNMGKVVYYDASSRIDPVAGKDVYLTIKKDWQEDIYQILKQRVAGILLSKISDMKTFTLKEYEDTTRICIPVYDCYFQLINNNIIDIYHFESTDATELEKTVQEKFLAKQKEVFRKIYLEFNGETPKAFNDQPKQMQEYLHYIENTFLYNQEEILIPSMVDPLDSVYKQWNEGTISLKEYLVYASSQNWVDISRITTVQEYLDSQEVYDSLAKYVEEKLKTDDGFSKLIYKYMLQDDNLSGEEVCLLLYEQGVLDKSQESYQGLKDGSLPAYNFMLNKIYSLEIEPAMLALDPYSASCVVEDPWTGEVLACVSYPGYLSGKLSNNMDTDYYAKLALDLSSPFYNKATQQRTAPGSTFKIASSITGTLNGYLSADTKNTCTGVFDLVTPPINCWNKYGCGDLDLAGAIEQSCNFYFNTIGYELGRDNSGVYQEDITLAKLQEAGHLMALDQKSGIELMESSPNVSDTYGVPSYMGQGTNLYTTTQLARYCGLIANSGTAYKLTLIDKITDPDGTVIDENDPQVVRSVLIGQSIWNAIHDGMRRIIKINSIFSTLKLEACGKTGTAQEQADRPDHALIIGYAPMNAPEYAIAIRVANGYASGNTCYIADDVFKYIFSANDRKDLITGTASEETSFVSND